MLRQHGPDFVTVLQRQHGDLFYATPPLLPPIYFLLHPDQVYHALVQHKPRLQKPKLMGRMLESSFGQGLFASEGALWQKQRRLMQPTFHHGKLERFATQMTEHTSRLIASWKDGQVIGLDEMTHALTLTVAVDSLFSADASGQAAAIGEAMHQLGQGLTAESQSVLLTLLPDWVPLPKKRQKRQGAQSLDEQVNKLIAERERLGEANSPQDLLTILLFSRDAETGERMSHQQLRDELVTLFIAGHETTAVWLNWTFCLLDKHPETAEALRTELKYVLNGRAPTVADLPSLTLTNQILKEAIRLYPPAWFLFREVGKPIAVNGDRISEGSILFLFPYANQRDKRWFVDPLAFKPERWMAEFERQLPKGAYFPFGMGPRVCIGNGFAQMEAQLILATIAQRWQLRLLDEPRVQSGSPTLGFAQPVRGQLVRIV